MNSEPLPPRAPGSGDRRGVHPATGLAGLLAGLIGLLLHTGGCALLSTGSKGSPPSKMELVQSAVMREADYYAANVAQASDDFRRKVDTSEARTAAQEWKLTQATAAYINATGEIPLVGAADLVVLATLSRFVVEDNWVNRRFGDPARPLLKVHTQLESNAWRFAETVLTPAQLGELNQLLQEFRLNNPRVRLVTVFRLPELVAELSNNSLVPRSRRSANLLSMLYLDPLSNLDPTTQAIQQTRILAQRAMYYAQRAPKLLSWQVELTVFQLADQPEVRGLLADIDDVAGSSKIFARTAQGLPEVINTQREAAIHQLLAGVAAERTNILADLAAQESRVNQLLPQLRETLIAGNDMARSVNGAVQTLDTFVRSVAPNPTNAAAGVAGTNSRPFDVLDYGTAAGKIGEMSRELNTLLATLDQTVPQVSRLSAQASADAKAVANHAFRLGVLLILILGVVTVLVVQVCRRLGRTSSASSETQTNRTGTGN